MGTLKLPKHYLGDKCIRIMRLIFQLSALPFRLYRSVLRIGE